MTANTWFYACALDSIMSHAHERLPHAQARPPHDAPSICLVMFFYALQYIINDYALIPPYCAQLCSLLFAYCRARVTSTCRFHARSDGCGARSLDNNHKELSSATLSPLL